METGTDLSLIEVGAAVFLAVLALICGTAAVIEGVRKKRQRKRIMETAEKGKNPEPVSLKVVKKTAIRRDGAQGARAPKLGPLAPYVLGLRKRLDAAGGQISLKTYFIYCAAAGGMVLFGLTIFAHLSFQTGLLLGIAAAIFLPHKFIGMQIARRQNSFIVQFPEALELMVRGLRSGIPVNESMRAVAREIPDPVGGTFREILDNMGLGRSFSEALATVSERLNLADFHFFEISLSIQQETGGNLAETLEGLASTLRKRKQMKLKVKALSSEARASAYILGSLPFLMFGAVDLINPGYMSVLLHDPRGHIVLAMAIATLVLGVFSMIKMGQFEI